MNDRKKNVTKMVLSAFFLALALVLPFLTGQIREIGNMLCPMHFPVMLCGLLCGWQWGLAVGLAAPLLRFLLFSMPQMPMCLAMAAELAAYGFAAGLLNKLLPKKTPFVYVSLVGSMIFGRLVYGGAMLVITGINGGAYTLSAFWTAAVVNAVPGIIAQIILIVPIFLALKKTKLTV